MARKGVFGRQPRVAQSLNATLLAIARQFQQQRDQNLMDAWQKGGMFEGQKATDELVLAHWKERLAGVSVDDPLHDTYANSIQQITYSIAESKMTALYSQQKASDAQMINFYLGWAKKVPQDSEFYRVLQRDAGQYMRNARANSVSLAKQAAENQYQSQMADIAKKEAAGSYMIDTLRRIAQSGYADGGISALIGAPGSSSDLTDFDPSDPAQMLRLLQAITPNSAGAGSRTPGLHANADVIYHDDNGKGITGQAIMDQLHKLDPSLQAGQPLDVQYITGLLQNQINGLDERIALANKTGHLTDAANLQKSKEYVATINREVAAWPIEKSYAALRSTFDQVANDPTASPQAVLKAWDSYRASLQNLAQDPRIAADDNLRSRLMGEVNGNTGMPTLAESFTGLQNGAFDPQSAKDSANTQAHMAFLQQQVDAVNTGQAVWTYGVTKGTNPDGTPHFVPQAGGNEIGAADLQAVQAGGANMQSVTVPDPKGGAPIQMMITATPVFATATDPKTGLPLHPENANPIAYAYDTLRGGQTVTMYGFQTKDGFVFSADPPWDGRLNVKASSNGGNHLEVDLSPVVANMEANNSFDLTKNSDLQNGFHVQGATTSTGRPAAGGGSLTFDPQVAANSTSTRNATGGADPTSDFHSLTLSFLMDSPDGRSILNSLDKNPAFKTQLNNDASAYAGATWDAATGSYVPGTGDATKYQQAQNQINMTAAATSALNAIGGFIAQAAQLWQRVNTGSAFPTGQQQGDLAPKGALPSDTLQGTSFSALGGAFNPGTNTLKTASFASKPGLDIKTAGTIRVPGVGDTGFTPQATPQAPAPITLGPTQTGSVAPIDQTLGGTSSTQTGSTAPTQAVGGRYGNKQVPV